MATSNVKRTVHTTSNVRTKTSSKNTNMQSAKGRPMPGGKAPKRSRRESDFFYVNRKLPCLLLMVCFIAMIAVVAVNILPSFVPSLAENDIIKLAVQYTAPYRIMDTTPMDQREDEIVIDENGEETTVEYQDQTVYITLGDLLMGSINNLTGKYAPDTEDGELGSGTLDSGTASAAEVPGSGTAEGDIEGEEEEVSKSPFYDAYKVKELASGYTEGIAMTIVAYAPLAIALMVVIALINVLKAFFALFGRRVFKRFGLSAIICLICAVAVVLVGIGMISMDISIATAEENLTFEVGRAVDLLMSAFESAPETAEEVVETVAAIAEEVVDGAEEAEVVIPLPFQANLGLLVLLVLPIVSLVLSLGARKKIPYAIFD